MPTFSETPVAALARVPIFHWEDTDNWIDALEGFLGNSDEFEYIPVRGELETVPDIVAARGTPAIIVLDLRGRKFGSEFDTVRYLAARDCFPTKVQLLILSGYLADCRHLLEETGIASTSIFDKHRFNGAGFLDSLRQARLRLGLGARLRRSVDEHSLAAQFTARASFLDSDRGFGDRWQLRFVLSNEAPDVSWQPGHGEVLKVLVLAHDRGASREPLFLQVPHPTDTSDAIATTEVTIPGDDPRPSAPISILIFHGLRLIRQLEVPLRR